MSFRELTAMSSVGLLLGGLLAVGVDSTATAATPQDCATVFSKPDPWVLNEDGNIEISEEGALVHLVQEWGAVYGDSGTGKPTIILTQSLNLDNCLFTPIGSSAAPFNGTFTSENASSIDGLLVEVVDLAGGLFGVTENAEISNIRLTTPQVTVSRSDTSNDTLFYGGALIGHAKSGTSVTDVRIDTGSGPTDRGSILAPIAGGLVGFNEGTITGSFSSANVTAGNENDSRDVFAAGGLVGLNNGTISGFVGEDNGSRSTATGAVVSYRDFAGGFVGRNEEDGKISYSVAEGEVSTTIGDNAGGFAGENVGTIQKSSAIGDVTSGDDRAGGFVGRNDGLIEDSSATGNAESQGVDANNPGNETGGFVGRNRTDGNIVRSSASGSAKSDEDNAGGFVGQNFGKITLSTARGPATAGGDNAGGFVGRNSASGEISQSTAEGNAFADDDRAGGFAGRSTGVITKSNASGNAEATNEQAGGFVGYLGGGKIEESTATGNAVAGTNHAGGFVGEMDKGTLVTESIASGTAKADGEEAGGFVGQNRGTVRDSKADGNAEANRRVGGFVGVNYFVIENSGASGSATATTTRAGGFVGWNTNDSADTDLVGVIRQSFATGNATAGTSRAGGFAGVNGRENNATGDVAIVNSFATGNATADVDEAGGFVGQNRESVQFSYSIGQATSPSASGGFVGLSNGSAATALDSFWDVETSRLTTSSGGTGKSTAEMKAISTFNDTGTVGLDNQWGIISSNSIGGPTGTSTQLWGMGPSVNCGYPFLYWQNTTVITCATSNTSASSRERQASSPALHLDLQAIVGGPVAGAPVILEGQGLAPGSTMTLVLRSTPQTLTQGTASALGNVSTRAQLPAIPAGRHILTLTGTAPDGSLFSLVQSFTVGSDGTFLTIGAPTGTHIGGLAATGPSAALHWTGVVGLGALTLGLGLLIARSRKQNGLVSEVHQPRS